MNATSTHQQANYGELMNYLLKERARYGNEAEFKAFALAEVRRFVVDLRALEIEVTLRYNSGKISFFSPKE